MLYKQLTFEERFGVTVRNFGFTQIPNIAVRHIRELGTKPIDFTILTYLLTFPPEDFHAISTISQAIGAHPKTVRTAFLRMEKKRLIRRIFRTGEANIYDITGWVSKIQAYAISTQTPTQKSDVVPTQISQRETGQNLGTNKHQHKEKQTMSGYEKYKEAKKKLGYN